MLFVWPVPFDLKGIYSQDYFVNSRNNSDFGYTNYDQDKESMREVFVKIISQLEKLIPGRRIFDVGAATGYFLDLTKQRGWQTAGTEISDYAAKVANERGHRVFCGELDQLPIEGKFDVVTMWDVLEHIGDPLAYLKKANDLLVDGGLVAINTVDRGSALARVLGLNWHLIVPPEHLNFYSRENLEIVLRQAGFEIISISTIGKKFSLAYIFKTLYFWQGWGLWRSLSVFFDKPFWRRWSLPVNLRDNIYILARKRSSSIVRLPGENAGKRKNLLICAGIYPPDIGGPATYVKGLERGLAEEFNVKIVTYGDQEGQEPSHVYKISRQQQVVFRYLKYFWQVVKLLPQADVVYIQGPVSEGLPAAVACGLRRKAYLLKIVGDFAWEQGSQRYGVKENLDNFQHNKYGFKIELWRRIEKWVAQKAKLVVVPSNYLKKVVTGWGIKADKINVIYNAIERIDIIENREQLRNKYGLDGFVMLSVGRLVPWKGLAALIEVVKELSAEINDLKLVIIGDGPERQNLENSVKAKGLEKNIIFTGQLSRSEVAAYLKAADLFILNTSYEGLSHVLIEAIKADLPIVTTAVGGNPELMEQYGHGFMVAYNNKPELIQAIKQARKINRPIETTGDFLLQFDYDFMVSQTGRLLRAEAVRTDIAITDQRREKILNDCDRQTIVLVQINFSQDHSETVLPLGILSVGSHLKRCGYKVELVNITEKQITEIAAIIAEKNPLCVGLSVMTGVQTRQSAELSKKIKTLNKAIPIIWGGIHPSLLPEQCLGEDYIDFVVISEGEITTTELVEKIIRGGDFHDVLGIGYKQAGKITINPNRPFIANLDDFRLDWSLLDLELYISPLKNFKRVIAYKASRGCPFNCSFCYNNAFNQNKWRVWSVEAVAEDINWLKEHYQIDAVKFYDDNFFVDKNRAWQILEKINLPTHLEVRIDTIDDDLAQKLKEFRVFDMLIGVESGSDRILSLIDKRFTVDRILAGVKLLAKYNLPATYSAIVGLPTETKEEFDRTVDLFNQIKKIQPSAVFSLGAYLPYPGSKMYDFAIKQGFKPPTKTEDWGKIDRFRKDFSSPWVNAQKVWRIREYFKLLNWRLGPIIKWFKWRIEHRFFAWPIDIYLVEYFGGIAIEQRGFLGKTLRKIYNLLRR